MQKRKQKSSLKELEQSIADFGLMNPDVYRWALSLYDIWVQSNYVAWPFEGGSANQPAWVIHDFSIFGLLDQWIDFDRQTLEESRAANGDVMDD